MQASNPGTPCTLARRTDHWFQRAEAALLGQVPCRAGCSHCCIGPFPITLLDVRLLQEGLAGLPADQRERIERRAGEQVSTMEAAFPQLTESPYLDRWPDTDVDRIVSDFHNNPCPALGEDGRCGVYEYRPLTCRSMGIPTEQKGIVSGACEVQTFVPVVRLSAPLRREEDQLAEQEARALERCRSMMGAEGDELLLPYGFLPVNRQESQREGLSPT
ncbi:MAG TPA: YkgJ family cysteine cluster protein [Nitrospira sp.]|nr:YkgJ family cysteine cluster protein [Nitrospira sp.]